MSDPVSQARPNRPQRRGEGRPQERQRPNVIFSMHIQVRQDGTLREVPLVTRGLSALHFWAWWTTPSSIVLLPPLLTCSQRLAQMSLELGFLRPTSKSFWNAWPRTNRMQKPQTTSEKVNTPPDGFIVSTDRTECCSWCCRMGHTRKALRRHKVTPRGRTASDANGATVDYS